MIRKIICISLILLAQIQYSSAQSKYSRQPSNNMLDSAIFYTKQNPAKAYDFVEKALSRAIKEDDKQTEAQCYNLIGDINYNVLQYDLAIDNYNKALKIYTAINNKKGIIKTEELLAQAYQKDKNFAQSKIHYNSISYKTSSEEDKSVFKKSKKKLAEVYFEEGEEEKAIQELEEVREMDIESGNKVEQLATNKELIKAYSESHPELALEIADENEALAIETKDTIALINTLSQKADVYRNLKQPETEIKIRKQSLEVSKAQNNLENQSQMNLKISEVLIEQEKIDDAIEYLKESIKQSDKTGNIETKTKALKSLSKAYDISGDNNLALINYKEYVLATEQSAKIREKNILKNLELMQSLTKKLQRIDMLENQKTLNLRTIQVLEQERKIKEKSIKHQRIIISSLIFGLALLLFAIYLIYKSSSQKRIANQLMALRALRSQMNPHFIFNALNSVNSFISKSDERSANKYLTDFSKLMRAVMENSKYDFVSLASEIEILKLYLKLEHHRFTDKFDYTFFVDDKIDQESVQIPPMLIQPYIENSVWHGLRYKDEKGYLKVNITNDECLNVTIEDNGIGRKKSEELKTKNQKTNVSTGLKNINNRLKIINEIHGTNLQVNITDLDKQKQTGTVVSINIFQKFNK